jgi:hypothetical protein
MPRSLYRSLLSSHLKKRFAAVAFRLACTMLIDSAPEIMLLAVDPKEHFVQTYSGEPRPFTLWGVLYEAGDMAKAFITWHSIATISRSSNA